MEPGPPPPWRAFDAPGSSIDEPTAASGAVDRGEGAASSAGPIGQQLLVGGRPAIVAGLVAAVGGIALAFALASGGLGGDVTLDAADGRPIGSAGPSGSTAFGGTIVVDVTGAVLQPGVYHLAAGSRIGDAIAAAGGYSPRVAAEQVAKTLNLAALVHDGDLIVVPSRDDAASTPAAGGGGSGGSGSGGGPGALVDLNKATAEALDALPGIGPVTAAKIIASRTDSPFGSVDDLLSRKLVGQKVFDQIRTLVTVR